MPRPRPRPRPRVVDFRSLDPLDEGDPLVGDPVGSDIVVEPVVSCGCEVNDDEIVAVDVDPVAVVVLCGNDVSRYIVNVEYWLPWQLMIDHDCSSPKS